MPEFVPFQPVKLVASPAAGDRWLHEIEYDDRLGHVRDRAKPYGARYSGFSVLAAGLDEAKPKAIDFRRPIRAGALL